MLIFGAFAENHLTLTFIDTEGQCKEERVRNRLSISFTDFLLALNKNMSYT